MASLGNRPSVRRADFWCVKCQKIPDTLEQSGLFIPEETRTPEEIQRDIAWAKKSGIPMIDMPESTLSGVVHCHGQRAEFLIPFSKVSEFLDSGMPMRLFETQEALPATSIQIEVDKFGENRQVALASHSQGDGDVNVKSL